MRIPTIIYTAPAKREYRENAYEYVQNLQAISFPGLYEGTHDSYIRINLISLISISIRPRIPVIEG